MYRKNFKQRPKGHSPGLFGLENPIISNGVYKKLAISNFNQIALVVPKLGAILENSSLY